MRADINLDKRMIRLESVKIAAQKQHPAYGISEILFDAKTLFDFIITGEIPEPEKQRKS
jgi:hypothetical protein